MRSWDILRMRCRSLLRRRGMERELDRELQFHLDEQIAENRSLGMGPEEARYAALRRLGGWTQIQEECRDMRRTGYLEELRQDLRYAARTLAKNPGFAVVIVLTLGLSIGANSAIFSVIDGVLLRPLPFPDAGRIVRVFTANSSYPKFPMNHFDFRDVRERNRTFDWMALYTHADVQLSGSGDPVKLSAFRVTAGYFGMLGLKPARGREFQLNEELPGNGNVAVLSDRVWRERFASDAAMVGRKIVLDGEPFTVVGVMPPGVQHPGNYYHAVADGETVDVWCPFTFRGGPQQRGSHYTEVIGRIKRGVTPAQAEFDLNAIFAELAKTYKAEDGWKVFAVPLHRELVEPARRMLLVLMGAVGLVLLIACANAANLLLSRATARQREIAVRAALGAGRGRLVRQMLAESVLISLAGGALGAGLAVFGVRALVALLPAGFPRAGAIHLDAMVFLFTLTVAIGTGVLFGLAPALHALRTDLQQNLGGRAATSSGKSLWLRNGLVVGEIGLACLLLIGAGLMLRSFVNLLNTDPGFKPEHVLTASMSLPGSRYNTNETINSYYTRLLEKVAATPGVRSAGAGTDLPWTGYDENAGINIEGKTAPPNQEFHARYHAATPDYFRALGIPLIAGRFLDGRDKKGGPQTILINQAMAARYWAGEDAVGKRFTFGDHPAEKDWITIVGVVGDVKDRPEAARAEPAFWWPEAQQSFNRMSVVVRAAVAPASMVDRLRTAARELDPAIAVADIRLMDDVTDASVATPRFTLFLIGLFAGLALTLAAIGMYGVIAYTVSRRTHEFGLRMALGAKPADVLRLVLGHGLKLAAIGVAAGVVGAVALSRVFQALLYEVPAIDPVTYAVVPLGALGIAAFACYVPARRATRSDPMAALRAE